MFYYIMFLKELKGKHGSYLCFDVRPFPKHA